MQQQQPNSPIIMSQIDLNGDDENNTIDTRLVNPIKKRMRLTVSGCFNSNNITTLCGHGDDEL
jgi:hypothetical protein